MNFGFAVIGEVVYYKLVSANWELLLHCVFNSPYRGIDYGGQYCAILFDGRCGSCNG